MTHQWPQNQKKILIDDHPKTMMPSSSPPPNINKAAAMEKTNPSDPRQQNPPPPPHLKCPRCDSANTKFCYYNNYSLSQPRHFCKACKRYWTRGGTLRNVPVGGGCRKNKKLRRPSSSAPVVSAAAAATNPSSHVAVQQQQLDLSSQTSNYMNTNPSSFYPLELNFPFSRYSNSTTRVSSDNNNTGMLFDLQQPTMMNGLGLGFSSPFSSTGNNNYNSVLFGSSSGFASSNSTSTMASLLASTLQHQKFGISDDDPSNNYEDNNTQNRSSLAWINYQNNNPLIGQINDSSPDPASSWNTTNNSNVGSNWFDPSNNLGSSSVPSLI